MDRFASVLPRKKYPIIPTAERRYLIKTAQNCQNGVNEAHTEDIQADILIEHYETQCLL